jgi:hypothetical protein
MLKLLLSFLLNRKPSKSKNSEIQKISLGRSFPELRHIELELLQKMNRTMRDLEVFCTIVQCLNQGLEDTRLATSGGTLQALRQLQEYSLLIKNPQMVVVNKRCPKKAEDSTAIFFEV